MQLWTMEHAWSLLPALVVMVAITLILRHFLKDRDWKIRMIPFRVITVLMLLMEVGKQALSLRDGYDLYHIPLHYCSLFLYVYPLAAFYSGKYCRGVRGIAATISSAVFLLMLIYPNLIYSGDNIRNYFHGYFDFHTVTFHNLVMLSFLLIPALNLHTPEKKRDLKNVIWFMVVFFAAAATMAQLLETNFANFYSCNIPVFESLRTVVQPIIGYALTQFLYVLCVAALQLAFTIGAYGFYRFLRKLLMKNRENMAV